MYTERQKRIIQYLSEVKFARLEQLAEEFDVSVETVRRDLLVLEQDAAIKRIRGGAIFNALRAKEVEFDKKMNNYQPEKQAIVRLAAQHIRDHEAIILSNGGINIMLARELAVKRSDLTVITNSSDAAAILNENQSHKVILTGGEIRKHNKSLIGSLCIACLDQFKVDKAIVNIDGISIEHGVTEINIEEAAVIRKMLEISQTKVILCDYGRFNEVALHRVCRSENIDMVFTDWNISEKEISNWNEHGVRVLAAQKEKPVIER